MTSLLTDPKEYQSRRRGQQQRSDTVPRQQERAEESLPASEEAPSAQYPRYNLRKRARSHVSSSLENPAQVSRVPGSTVSNTGVRLTVNQPQGKLQLAIRDDLTSATRRSGSAVDTRIWARYYSYEPWSEDEGDLIASPVSEMASTAPESSVPPTDVTARDAKSSKKGKQVDARHNSFYNGLMERNIDFEPTSDPGKKWINKILSLETTSIKSTHKQEENWKNDLSHCRESDEAMFQRTAMMDLLDRHQLNICLDYICETPWTCARMPRKRPAGAAELALPKPDLAVAFRTRSLISEGDLRSLTHLKGLICPEASRETKDIRAFHFFAMEAKGVDVNQAKAIAYRQNFNTASQALHNIYGVMRAAEQEDVFFDQVRVFTAVATADFFSVRVHRAEQLDLPRKFIEPDYPLEFKFDEVVRVIEPEYTRSRVLGIVHSILFSYGVKTLQPVLKIALSRVLQKLDKVAEARKRPADDPLESFDSSRVRLNALDVGSTGSQRTQIPLAV